MPKPILSFAAALLAVASVPNASADCNAVIKKLRADLAATPERVLIYVEDGVVVNEDCACEIVKTAIVDGKADGKLVSQIVFTVASVAPHLAVTAGECALAVAPDAEADVKAGLKKALGKAPTLKSAEATTEAPETAAAEEVPAGENPAPEQVADGKNPRGKNPLPPERAASPEPGDDSEVSADFPQIMGPFLTHPNGGATVTVEEKITVRPRPQRPTRNVRVVVPQPTSTASDDLTPVD